MYFKRRYNFTTFNFTALQFFYLRHYFYGVKYVNCKCKSTVVLRVKQRVTMWRACPAIMSRTLWGHNGPALLFILYSVLFTYLPCLLQLTSLRKQCQTIVSLQKVEVEKMSCHIVIVSGIDAENSVVLRSGSYFVSCSALYRTAALTQIR